MSLDAFRRANFHSVRRLKEVWTADEASGHEFHKPLMTRFDDALERLIDSKENQRGLIVTGAAGSGKTHTLGQIRRRAMRAGAHFVLIDCTDIRDFWQTLTLQYLQSLQQEYIDESGQPARQIETILGGLIRLTGSTAAASILPQIRGLDAGHLVQLAGDVAGWLGRRGLRKLASRHRTIRALFYLYSDQPELGDLAYAFLQGQTLDPLPEIKEVGLEGPNSARTVVTDLALILANNGPTVLAFDQMDPIIAEHHQVAADAQRAERQHEAIAVINGLANGLMSLHDQLEQTLPVLSILESSWVNLRNWALSSAVDRFADPATLPPPRMEQATAMVQSRLARAYRQSGFAPPYPSWPFRAEFFASVPAGWTPREILNRCERHRQQCLDTGEVTELTSCGGGAAPPAAVVETSLAARYEELRASPDIAWMMAEENEDRFGDELAEVCAIFLRELPLEDNIDYQLDHEFHETRSYESLHVRMRRIFRAESDREEHVCMRVLSKSHYRSFQVRLTAAMTMAGISEGLPGRSLTLLRQTSTPRGAKTEQMVSEFLRARGRILAIAPEDLAAFDAVRRLEKESPERFESWLRHARPLGKTAFFRETCGSWFESPAGEAPVRTMAAAAGLAAVPATPAPKPVTPPPAAPKPVALNPPPPIPRVPVASPLNGTSVLVGMRNGTPSQIVAFPRTDLTRHVVARAGSGSGKTVLLKRLVEEAALASVSSIVIDSARDMSYLLDPWPAAPEGWFDGDAARARRYENEVAKRLWTPGRKDGRPMSLSPIPDFRGQFDDPIEFDTAVELATDGLAELVIKARDKTVPRAILKAAMTWFGRKEGHQLAGLVEILSELPGDARTGIQKEEKIAAEMGDRLRAVMLQDPLLAPGGEPLDPAVLFGADNGGATVSVISLFAMNDLSAQATFIGRLASALFSWIRRNPAKDGIRGLLVLDEAAPFLPSRRSAESKAALLLLSQQARKYGLGLVLATQNPMDLDYNATAQFATQLFGAANQPQVIRYIEEAMVQRGMRSLQPGRLKPGQFYVASPSLREPVKVQSPMCLSWHPNNRTPTDDEILERSRRP
ncbi:MAG: AAA family ATPase [Bryobacteraceae bacterium]